MGGVSLKPCLFKYFNQFNLFIPFGLVSPPTHLTTVPAVFLTAITLLFIWAYNGEQLTFGCTDNQGIETSGVPP